MPGIPPEGSIEPLQAMLDSGERESVLTTFYREGLGLSPQQVEQFRSLPEWPGQVAAAYTLPRELRAFQEYELDARHFQDLQTPTLLLLGGASPPIVKSATEAADKVLPNSEIAVISEPGHFAHQTAPDLFVRHVLTFLNGPG